MGTATRRQPLHAAGSDERTWRATARLVAHLHAVGRLTALEPHTPAAGLTAVHGRHA